MTKTPRKRHPSPRLAPLATPLPQGERGTSAHAERKPRIRIGRIGAPHGVRGEVKLWSFTADPMAIAAYGVLENADGSRTLEIETLRSATEFLVAQFKGIANRAAATKLRNLDLYVARDRLPDIGQGDEYYFADLVGLAAMDRAGVRLGEIVAVHNFGAGDLLELKLTDERDTRLIPFTEATVPEIDIAGGRAVVQLPNEIDASPESEA